MEDYAKVGWVIGDLSGVRVHVTNYDVKFIPHFIPLVDLGVEYPVRTILDVVDRGEDEGSNRKVSEQEVVLQEKKCRNLTILLMTLICWSLTK